MREGRSPRRGPWGRLEERRDELLWGAGRGRLSGGLGLVGRCLWKFQEDRCFLRASALTYTTLLSLVPLLALAFSILKGFGVQRRLEPLILEHFAAGNDAVVARILEYIDRTQVGSLGALGLAGLLFTAVSVLGNVELSFNDIWQIRQGRRLVRKVTDYIALLIVSPVLLLASLSLTTTLHTPAFLSQVALLGPALRLLLRVLPFAATWLAFTAAYLILPNRRVPLSCALLGGVAAGSLWHLAEWAYIRFQFGVAQYNAIYGALAQLPLLLVWVYVSWCVVLFGAQLACLYEMPGRGRALGRARDAWVPRVGPAVAALLEVARRFEAGEGGPVEQDLLVRLGLDPAEGQRILARLKEAGLLVATQGEPPRLMPAVAPDRTTAADLLARVLRLDEGEPEPAAPVTARVRRAVEAEFGEATWADLSEDGGP